MIKTTNEILMSNLFNTNTQTQVSQTPNNNEIFNVSSIVKNEVSVFSKDINKIYSLLKQQGNDKSLKGFREYIKDMATNYSQGDFNNFALMGRELSEEKAEVKTISSLFANYANLLDKNEKNLGNILIDTAISSYEKFGKNNSLEFIYSVNKIFDIAGEEELTSTIKDFLTVWNKIENDSNMSKETKIEEFNKFTSNLNDQQDIEGIKNVIAQNRENVNS